MTGQPMTQPSDKPPDSTKDTPNNKLCPPTTRTSLKKSTGPFPVMPQRDELFVKDQINQVSCTSGVTKGMAILDTGASRSVIGIDHVPALLQKLPENARSRVKEKPSKIGFRFGNNQVSYSFKQLQIPLIQGKLKIWLLVEVVPKATPFLLSIRAMKSLGAVIDLGKSTCYLETVKRSLPLHENQNGLFVIDVADLCQETPSPSEAAHTVSSDCVLTPPPGLSPIDHADAPRSSRRFPSPCRGDLGVTSSPLHDAVHDDSCDVPRGELGRGRDASHSCSGDRSEKSKTEDHGTQPVDHRTDQYPQCDEPSQFEWRTVRRLGSHRNGGRKCSRPSSPRITWPSKGCSGPWYFSANCFESTIAQPDLWWETAHEDCRYSHSWCPVATSSANSIRSSRIESQSRWRSSCPNASRSGCLGGKSGDLGSQSQGADVREHVRDRSWVREVDSAARGVSARGHRGFRQLLHHKTPSRSSSPTASAWISGWHPVPSRSIRFSRPSKKDPVISDHDEAAWMKEVLKIIQKGNNQCQQYDVLEIYAYPNSQLTDTAIKCGLKAKRFTREDGDLSTGHGRIQLLVWILLHRPKHVWMAPTCAPWCAWSRFNAQRSLQGYNRVRAEQHEALIHLKLCNLICKIQLSEGRHAHLENPWTSAIWQQSALDDFMKASLSAKLDQCMFDLKHPENSTYLEKKTCVQTSSRDMWNILDSRLCNHQHEHTQIAGQCQFRGHSMRLSQYASFYPKTFAKAIVKGIMTTKEGPIEKPIYHVDIEEPPSKRARREEPINPEESKDQSPWKAIFDRMRQDLPKSGIQTWTNPFHEVFKRIQDQFPDDRIGVIRAGKGLDRYITGEHVWRDEFPFRHTTILHRTSRDIEDLGCEEWPKLPKIQQHRRARPSHVMICVFLERRGNRGDTGVRSEVSDTTPAEHAVPIEDQSRVESSATPSQVVVPPWTPLSATVSGPKFLSLSEADQGIIRKLHRNLGHPTAEKLSRHLADMHAQPQLVEGAKDFQCESCAERHAPQRATPGNLKDPLEFNERISIDGFDWKSSSGYSAYVIHILDEATRFHLGYRTMRDSTLLVKGVKDQWVKWAGLPKQIAHDQGGEFIAEPWKFFLQENGIQPVLSSAPWQRGRIERHGGIIQEMLDRIDQDTPIQDNQQFDEALYQCFHAKNTMSAISGYSPEQAVLGKASKLPASIASDEDLTSHLTCAGPDLASDRFKNKLELRAKARAAFAYADNSSAIRRALNHQSRGVIHSWSCGQLCMYWDKRRSPNMLEKGRWNGPAQVICAESRTIVWISHLNRLLRCARENLRPVSLREFQRHSTFVQTSSQEQLQQMARRLQEQLRERSGLFQYQDLSSIEPEDNGPNVEDNPNSELGLQPEEEPNRKLSVDLQSQDLARDRAQAQLQEALDTPVPESPIATPPAEDNSMSDEPAADTVSFDSDHTSEPTDTDMQPVYNAIIQENASGNDIVIEDQDSFWHGSDEIQAACTSFTFEVPNQQFHRFLRRPEEHLDCLVAAAKKSRNEVVFSELNVEEKKLFQAAKQKELNCWLDTQTVKAIMRDKIHPSRILASRWILTWKEDQNSPNGRKAKARLVVKGFQDPDIGVLNSDSPTLTRDSRMLLLQTISSKRWVVQSFDITTAFLRGRSDDRELAMEAPSELKNLMGLDNSQVCLLQGNAYGRVDAPLLFYKEFRKQLEELGFEAHPLDNCLFMLRDPKNPQKLDGILGTHVDDGIGGGNQNFEDALQKLQKNLPFGSREYGKFKFTGLDIEQLPDHSIKVCQSRYVHKICPIGIPKTRRSENQSPISPQEMTQLRGLCGSLQYAAVHSRPDIATKVANLQKGITSATVETLLEGNRVLREAQQYAETAVIVRPLPLEDVCFASFGDASFASAKQLSAQQGLFIMACTPKLAINETTEFSPVVWHSKQIGRVVRSTLSAEAYSMSSSLDKLTWIRCMWGYIKNPDFAWHQPERSLEGEHKGLMITDCKSLYDLISKNAVPNCQEWRTTIEVMLLKEQSRNHTTCRWVSTAIMLADCLTKAMDATFLRTVLQLGKFRIYDEDMTLKQNATRKYGVTWVHENMENQGLQTKI